MSSGDAGRFGKYRLLQRIAAGGMGEVHLAKLKGPSGFEKLVVIKRLLDHRQREQKYIDMFFSEARVAAQLNHSNIVQIYEVGNYDGVHYIAMEYVQGKSLRTILDTTQERYGSFPAAYAAQITIELCAGLAFAHDARHLSGASMGLIHRDINPHNVLLSYRGEVKVIDFGIAKSELTLEQTQAGTIKGTVVYMSPEQASGRKLDKRSDIFSVGICLYEALTGENPFYKDTLTASLEAIRQASYPPLVDSRPELAPFTHIVAKALARSPDERYSDCAELADKLQAVIDTGQVAKAATPLPEFLRTMFADDIAQEERMLSQTELAEVPLMGSTETHAEMALEHTPQQMDVEEATVADDRPAEPTPPLLPPAVHPARRTADRVASPGLIAAMQRLGVRLKNAIDPRIKAHWRKPHVRYGLSALSVLLLYAALWFSLRTRPAPEVHTGLPTPPAALPRSLPDPAPILKGPPDLDSLPNAEAAVPKGTPPNAALGPTAPAPPTADSDTDPAHRAEQRGHVRPLPLHKHPKARPNRPEAEVSGLGLLHLQLEPQVRVTLNSANVSPPAVRLHAPNGTLQVGTGANNSADAFVVRVHYRIDQKNIVYAVESEPWANVFGPGGIPLGRTPLQNITGSGATVFEFRNPKVGMSQRVTLRFAP